MCIRDRDGIHVHPAAINLLVRAVGDRRVCLVTDSLPLAGLPPGKYRSEGREVHVTMAGHCILSDGTIAGSTTSLIKEVQLYTEVMGSFNAALTAATLNPARAMGIAHRKGSLTPGYDADLVVVHPNWDVLMTIVNGQIVYDRERHQPTDFLNPFFHDE